MSGMQSLALGLAIGLVAFVTLVVVFWHRDRHNR